MSAQNGPAQHGLESSDADHLPHVHTHALGRREVIGGALGVAAGSALAFGAGGVTGASAATNAVTHVVKPDPAVLKLLGRHPATIKRGSAAQAGMDVGELAKARALVVAGTQPRPTPPPSAAAVPAPGPNGAPVAPNPHGTPVVPGPDDGNRPPAGHGTKNTPTNPPAVPAPPRAAYPSAVVLAGRRGVVALLDATGYAVKYGVGGKELPREEWVPATTSTIYDVASLSKLFTSLVAVQQIERGKIQLDRQVVDYIPAFASHKKSPITIRQLLTHTSGLVEFLPLYRDYPTKEARLAAVYDAKPVATPGTKFIYSDLNLITLGSIVELVTGQTLDKVVQEGLCKPLGMTHTGYNPTAPKNTIAATEDESYAGRGMVHGQVHDENAWSLDGVAGHAGVFSTANDLAILAQTILNGGTYGRARILSKNSTALLLTDFNKLFPTHEHGLGFELNQTRYMGGLSSLYTAGHTGFTGTSIVINISTETFAILLTNRVHPDRNGPATNPIRAALGDAIARSVKG